MKNKKRIGTVFLLINILIAIVYFIWRIKYTLPVFEGCINFVFAIVFLLTEIFGILLLWFQLCVIRHENKKEFLTDKEYSDSDYPEVDVFVVNDGKKKIVVKDTVNACLLMDYPDKEKVHVFEIKGGTMELNEGIKNSSSPLVAVIEAGMFPRHKFLQEMVTYYLRNVDLGEKIGFIQACIGAFNADSYQFRLFSQKLVPNKNRFFYKCQQPVFDNDNSVIFSGSGAVFSREALNEIGGFDTKCVSGFVATGIKLQKHGYRCKYLNKILISGFFSSDISECISEWKIKITDVLEAFKNEKVLSSKELSRCQKADYAAYATSFAMPFRCAVTLLMPVLVSLFDVMIFDCSVAVLASFWAVMYITADLAMINITDKVTSIKWNNIRKISTAPFVWIPIIKVFFGIHKHEKIKRKKTNVFQKMGYLIPFVFLMVLYVVGIFRCIAAFKALSETVYLLIASWLFVNLYYSLMSVFWIIGRPYVRQEERVDVSVNYVMTDKLSTVCGVTRDMSTRGVSVWCDKPYDIDNEEIINIKLDNGRYQAEMQGNVIGVETEGRHWKYIVLFKNMEESRQQYFALLYDRTPEETEKVSASQNIFSDLKRNIGKRFKHKALEYRRMARIPVNQNVMLSDGDEIYVKNYNYKYLLVYSQEKPKDTINLVPVKGVEIECEKFHRFGDHTYMYKVMNYEQLRNDADMRNKIYDWVEQCAIENIIGIVSDSNLVGDTDVAGYF